jgi:hypothetical protein
MGVEGSAKDCFDIQPIMNCPIAHQIVLAIVPFSPAPVRLSSFPNVEQDRQFIIDHKIESTGVGGAMSPFIKFGILLPKLESGKNRGS